jgi:replicative DNA helicase
MRQAAEQQRGDQTGERTGEKRNKQQRGKIGQRRGIAQREQCGEDLAAVVRGGAADGAEVLGRFAEVVKAELDKRTGGGLIGSKLMMIGARPSVGKSIFALTMCLNAARKGKKVLFSTLEMEADEITERVFANDSLVQLTEITSDEISTESWQKLASSLPAVSRLPIYYCTEADTVEELRRAAFTMYENGGIDLICVDYLQLMSGSKPRYGNRQEEVADISRGLKKLARELNVPIIALSQLSRFEKRDGKRRAPTMSDARESGAIEQDANIFILLHDPTIEELKTEDEKRMHKNLKDRGLTMIQVKIDKNRQGKKGWFYMAFDGDHMRFTPITKEDDQE